MGKTLINVSDYDCAHSICPKGCNGSRGYCHADTSTPLGTDDSSNISAKFLAMNKVYGTSYGWTNTDYNSCISYGAYFGGQINFNYRNNGVGHAVCK